MTCLSNATLLVVDDDPLNLIVMDAYLSPLCNSVIVQTDVALALALAEQKQPDLILLDVLMGEECGYEVCRQLKANPGTCDIPVIFLSSLIRPQDRVRGFAVGGVDFISKPFALEEMLARLESCLQVHQKIRDAANARHQATAAARQHLALTVREAQVLRLYAAGHSYHTIAEHINRSEHAVKWYIKKLFAKFEVDSRAALVAKARELGW